jgi:hypothetical protein
MKTQIRTIFILLTSIIVFSACSQKSLFDQRAGNLRLAINNTGMVTALEDISNGTNYIAPDEPSYLLECLKYGADSNAVMFHPKYMRVVEQTQANTKIELTYAEGEKLVILITPKENYFKEQFLLFNAH